jgi:hypothetical protein
LDKGEEIPPPVRDTWAVKEKPDPEAQIKKILQQKSIKKKAKIE